MLDYLTVGTVVNVHGVHGEVKVIPQTDDVNRFRDLKTALLFSGGVRRKIGITGVKFSNKFVILKFEGIDDRDTADKMRGVEIQVERKDAIKLPEGRYFIGDLIGCLVTEENGDVVGRIRDVISGAGSDIYDVDCGEGRNMLIPVLEDVLVSVDVEAEKVTVKLPAGLREIYM